MGLIRKVRPALVGFVILTLVNIGGFAWMKRLQEGQCESGNQARTAVEKTFDKLLPASRLVRPGETPEQYAFRQDQIEDAIKVYKDGLKAEAC